MLDFLKRVLGLAPKQESAPAPYKVELSTSTETVPVPSSENQKYKTVPGILRRVTKQQNSKCYKIGTNNMKTLIN